MLIGRVTYEGFAGAWPGRDDEAGFAAKMNAMPKYVVSTILSNPRWTNSTVIAADIPGAIRELKSEDGSPILVAGSRSLLHSLYADDLVDEYRLLVFPLGFSGAVGGRSRTTRRTSEACT